MTNHERRVTRPIDVEARVIRNTRLSTDYNAVALAAPEIAAHVAPGQFVMVKPGRATDPLLRRPFSVFEILRTSAGIEGLTLLNKRIGVTTRMLYELVEGDVVACLGPLGIPFTVVEPPTDAWMIAGGVGLAPFATLLDALRARGTKTTLFYGARTGKELFYLDTFMDKGAQLVLSTEDGSRGDRGRVTLPLERELHHAPEALMLYACGPEPMLEAVSKLASRYGRPCEVSIERMMGCGLGGCYSCVIPISDGRGRHHYERSCIAGPVFAGESIVWE
jgi:dihydroorotate dehydrogenase electron transfer subunit